MSIWSKIEKKVSDVADEFLLDEEKLKISEASILLEKGESAKALSILQKLKNQNPNSKHVPLLLAKCYLETGATTTAIDTLYQLVSKHKESSEAYALIAKAQFGQRNFEPAIEATQNALRYDSYGSKPTLESRILRGKIFLLQHRPEAALKEFKQAAQKQNDDVTLNAYCAASNIFLGSQNEKDFTDLFTQTNENKNDFFITLAKATYHLSKGNLAQCLTNSTEALSQNDFKSDWPYILKAKAHWQEQDHLKAFNAMESALSLDSVRINTKILAAHIAFDAKQYKKCSDFYTDTIKALKKEADFERAFLSFIQSQEEMPSRVSLLEAAHDFCGATRMKLWKIYLEHLKGKTKEARQEIKNISHDLFGARDIGWHAFIKAQLQKGYDDSAALRSLKEACLAFKDMSYFLDHYSSFATSAAQKLTKAYNESNVFQTLESTCAQFDMLHNLEEKAKISSSNSKSPLTIAVMGEFSAGKSTLINTLLGEEIAKTGAKPTTEDFTLYTANKEPLNHSSLGNKRVYPLEVTNKHGCSGFNIFDTPGLNSGSTNHTTTALDVLAYSDVILWVFSASQAGSKSEFQSLQDIAKRGFKIFGVLGKADIATPKEQDQLITYLKNESKGVFEKFWVFSDRDPSIKQNFLKEFSKHFADNNDRLKTASNHRQVRDLTERIRQILTAQDKVTSPAKPKQDQTHLDKDISNHFFNSRDQLRANLLDLRTLLKEVFETDFRYPQSIAEPIFANTKNLDKATYEYIDQLLLKNTLEFNSHAFTKERNSLIETLTESVPDGLRSITIKSLEEWHTSTEAQLAQFLNGYFIGYTARTRHNGKPITLKTYREFLELFLLDTKTIANHYNSIASASIPRFKAKIIDVIKEDLLSKEIRKLEINRGIDKLLLKITEDFPTTPSN